jgi:peptide chain release factor 1
LLELLTPLVDKYESLQKKMAEGDIDFASPEYQQIQREYNRLEKIVHLKENYEKLLSEIEGVEEMLKNEQDEDLLAMGREEEAKLRKNLEKTEKAVKLALIPPDPNDEKNIIMEIRAGAGGDESGIFAGDLFRMYSMYAEKNNYKIEVMDASEQEAGGYKEIVFMIQGEGVYSQLKFESGVHRVQRVPKTESQGRIHTSTVTVAVLPEAEDEDVEIKPDEIKLETTKAQGAGGQHVNKTESAVKITHLPTGIIVHCQDERSQYKNRERAMKILRAKLKEKYEREKKEAIDSNRRLQVGTGERAEKIRTYNFPQNRVTDHRINLTIYHLDQVMDGGIEEVIEPLSVTEKEEMLESYVKNMKG